LFEWLKSPGCAQFRYGTLVLLAQLGWRQIGPPQATGNDILTDVLQHMQKRIVSLNDSAFEIPNADSQNIGLDQTPDLRFPICQRPIKSYILERDCPLRRKHLQHSEAIGRENLRGHIVFKVENADESSLVGHWET